jgi:hypothetical protein
MPSRLHPRAPGSAHDSSAHLKGLACPRRRALPHSRALLAIRSCHIRARTRAHRRSWAATQETCASALTRIRAATGVARTNLIGNLPVLARTRGSPRCPADQQATAARLGGTRTPPRTVGCSRSVKAPLRHAVTSCPRGSARTGTLPAPGPASVLRAKPGMTMLCPGSRQSHHRPDGPRLTPPPSAGGLLMPNASWSSVPPLQLLGADDIHKTCPLLPGVCRRTSRVAKRGIGRSLAARRLGLGHPGRN